MKRQKVAIIIAVIIATIISCMFLLGGNSTLLTEQAAIEAVKQKYRALEDYPSDMLPPRSISTVQSDSIWYIAFIQNGSGTPILEARCFTVGSDRSVTEHGTFVPKPGSTAQNISPATCDATQ